MVYTKRAAECDFFFHFEKVKLMVNPFAYEEYRKDRIRQKIEEARAQRVQLKVGIVLAIGLAREESLTFILCSIPKKLAIHLWVFPSLVYIFY